MPDRARGAGRAARAGVVATTVLGPGSIAVAAAFVLLGATGTAAVGPAHGPPDALPTTPVGSATDCGLPLPPSGVRGELTVDGGPLPANASGGVRLTYTYVVAYQTVLTVNDRVVASGCVSAEGNVTTAANGSFGFVPSTPPESCAGDATTGQQNCTSYSDPGPPVRVALAAGVPPGYAVSVVGASTPIAVALVYEFQSVTIAPGGPIVTTSLGGPTEFTATAWAANGSVSDLAPSFRWTLGGLGWSFQGPATGPSVNLTATVSSSIATVTVQANGSADGIDLAPVRASVEAVAIPTEVESGETNRTVLDAGGTLEVNVTAVGAAGYPYHATVEPGLGLPDVGASCGIGSVLDGTAEVQCSANVTYPLPGTAQPTATVTNGFSTGSWQFPNVVVNPFPALEILPAKPVGYVRSPLTIVVSALNGSGTPPYARACLTVLSLPSGCSASPGPVWTFSPTFDGSGNYSAVASAVDADGTNASTRFGVEVVPDLAVGPLSASAPNATVGSAVGLRANVSGGVLPLRYWWNLSGVATPLLQGTVASDGRLVANLTPVLTGPAVVTLTVVDRLGTVVATELSFTAAPAAPVRIASLLGPPEASVTVGDAIPLVWAAFDASGEIDRSFEAAVELDLRASSGVPKAWVNASAVGPLAPLGGGAFGVPASAWVEGTLSVNLTVETAALVAVELSGVAVPGSGVEMNVSVVPDREHVHLLAPLVVRAGSRSNTTLWRIEDPFGNPVPGALLTIDLAFGGMREAIVVAAIALPGGGSGVWINYSVPTSGTGEVTVVDAAGATVLGPFWVPAAPAAPPPNPTVDVLAAVVPVGAAGVATFAVARHRRRARENLPLEQELRRLAEGRAEAVELIGRAGAIDLAGLEAAWHGPAPPALAEWLASLVADGTVRTTLGEDGRARFCLAEGRPPGPHVRVDAELLDRALQRREQELDEPAGSQDDIS